MFVPLTPLSFIGRAEQVYGGHVGVVDGENRFLYRDFAVRCRKLAGALVELGLKPGERVAFLAYNSYPLLEGYFGVPRAGGVLLPLNIRLSVREIAFILDDSNARFLFADGDFAPFLADVLPLVSQPPTVVWLTHRRAGESGSLYDELLEAATELAHEPQIDECATAELFYTSGTTGMPKGVMLTHRNLYLHALSVIIALDFKDVDVQLHTIPLFHVNGWGAPQFITASGGTHVMLRKFDPGEALRLIEAERVTIFQVVPTMLNALINHPDVGRRDLSSLRLINTGGASTPPDLLQRAENIFGCDIRSGYGLTETSPVLSIANAKRDVVDVDERARVLRQASTGLPLIGADLRILGPSDEELPWDGQHVGEIVVRSNSVMDGYWRDPDGTNGSMAGGWFRTGDMAYIDPEGYVQIVDRKKDIIISGGETISSLEIERVIFEHPAVFEAAVVAVPDSYWGEVPKAFVSLRPGQSVTENELIEHCRARLASFKIPKAIQILPDLPKGGTGKILKRDLREIYGRIET